MKKKPNTALKRYLSILAAQKYNYIIAFDEFQQIVNYPEKNTEAILRTAIQHQHKDRFIFREAAKTSLFQCLATMEGHFITAADIMELKG
jgi:hypothetical protein